MQQIVELLIEFYLNLCWLIRNSSIVIWWRRLERGKMEIRTYQTWNNENGKLTQQKKSYILNDTDIREKEKNLTHNAWQHSHWPFPAWNFKTLICLHYLSFVTLNNISVRNCSFFVLCLVLFVPLFASLVCSYHKITCLWWSCNMAKDKHRKGRLVLKVQLSCCAILSDELLPCHIFVVCQTIVCLLWLFWKTCQHPCPPYWWRIDTLAGGRGRVFHRPANVRKQVQCTSWMHGQNNEKEPELILFRIRSSIRRNCHPYNHIRTSKVKYFL